MVGPQNGGSLDRFHIEVGVPVFSHFFHDLVPYLECCLYSDNCAKYFEKRPSDNGSSYEPPRPGNQPTNQPTYEPTDQSSKQATFCLSNQKINQSIDPFLLLKTANT